MIKIRLFLYSCLYCVVFYVWYCRFLKDAICGSVFYFIKVYGATEITLTLLRHVKANDTSVQAIGWIGEKGK